MVPLDDPTTVHKHVFIGITIGDCKVLLVETNGTIIDLTKGNRQNVSDARDPGGRIGT